ILLPRDLERSHRILDLVAVPRVPTAGHLSKQSIINLSHGGVPDEVFHHLMQKALEERAKALSRWDEPVCLWDAISKAGGIMQSRLRALSRGQSRALGLSGRRYSFENEEWD